MTFEIILVFAVVTLTVVLFVTEALRVDVVALIALALVLVLGVVDPAEGLAGFSSSATLTVGAMFVLSSGLSRTGVVDHLGQLVTQLFDRGFWFGLVAVMVVVGLLSAFINNTPVIAVFIPILLGVAKDTGISITKLLMPVSFASLFGGVCTLIGTSTNIIVNSIAEENRLEPFTMFEFAPLGVIMFAAGTAYMLIFGVRMIPERAGRGDLVEKYELTDYLTEIVIGEDSASVGCAIREAPLVKELDLTILRIERGGSTITLPTADERLHEGDILLVRCSFEDIRLLQERVGVSFRPEAKWAEAKIIENDFRLVEAAVDPDSSLVGGTLKGVRFREVHGAVVLAIRHRGKTLRERLSETTLRAGDLLLLEISRDGVERLRRSGDFLIISEREAVEFRRNKAIIAVSVVLGVVAAAAFGFAPIVVTSLVGALLLVLMRVISIEEAYNAIEWKIIFLLAGALSLGVALDRSGAANLISSQLLENIGPWGPIALVSAFYFLTSILTEAMTNNATAALLAPIALATASSLGVDPAPFLIAITFAASSSFMTPVGYKTNTMIFEPGRYKFVDFLRVGTPLNIIFWLIATFLIPVFWPFYP